MRLVPLAVAAAALLSGCTSGDSGSAAVQVVASFYPLAWAAERVGGDTVDVRNLTPAGVEPHDLELTPSQVGAVEGADLVLLVPGFQPALDDAAAGGATLDLLAAAEAGLTDEPGGDDPHFWLDPRALAAAAQALAQRLGELHPADAETFRRNGDALAAELRALDGAYRSGLANCARRELVTSHDAFRWLTARYDLTPVAVAGVSPDDDASPRDISRITAYARAHGVTTVFFETLVSPDVANTIAQEAGLRTAVLDPLEGLAEGSTDDYLAVMRRNLDAIRAGLGCR